MARIPLALSKPKPAETKEEFIQRFADEVMAALAPYRTKPAADQPEDGE